MRKLLHLIFISLGISIAASCDPIPPLHLHEGQDIDMDMPVVILDIDVMWHYDLSYMFEFNCDSFYNWRKEWRYGWDLQDSLLFGPIGYTKPKAFHIRKYYQGNEPGVQGHRQVSGDFFRGYSYRSNFNFGYYDLLLWNEIITHDGDVETVVFDEETTLDSVVVTTNPTRFATRYNAAQRLYSYNQPNEIFSTEDKDFYISRDPNDYDSYDPVTNTYYKSLNDTLFPVVYIYLTQVIMHHNKGRVIGTDGNANLSNMAYSATLNSGMSGNDNVTVHYNTRYKQGVELEDSDEKVDIIGGRLTTFGIREINPFRYRNPLEIPKEIRQQRHYLDVNFVFGNGNDTTIVFDVSNQVLRRYRGGVITIELDMDTIPTPGRAGGWGFDAIVQDFEEEEHVIEM